jgi:hypothetical protein
MQHMDRLSSTLSVEYWESPFFDPPCTAACRRDHEEILKGGGRPIESVKTVFQLRSNQPEPRVDGPALDPLAIEDSSRLLSFEDV